MIASQKPELIFEGGFDEREAIECLDRGYRSHVCIKFSKGDCYPIVFYDPFRLQQDWRTRQKLEMRSSRSRG